MIRALTPKEAANIVKSAYTIPKNKSRDYTIIDNEYCSCFAYIYKLSEKFKVYFSDSNGNSECYYANFDSDELYNLLLNISNNYFQVVDEEIKEMFPDWAFIKNGEWSRLGRIINTINGDKVEFGLYREPDNEEYAGTLTLQVFINDDVVICKQVSKDDLF